MRNHRIALAIQQLPGHLLTAGVRGDRALDASCVRQEFASWVAGQRGEFASWQHAWNAWTGARPNRPGRIEAYILCPSCRGRMFDLRHGVVQPCPTCMTRKRVWVRAAAMWQQPADGAELPTAAATSHPPYPRRTS